MHRCFALLVGGSWSERLESWWLWGAFLFRTIVGSPPNVYGNLSRSHKELTEQSSFVKIKIKIKIKVGCDER